MLKFLLFASMLAKKFLTGFFAGASPWNLTAFEPLSPADSSVFSSPLPRQALRAYKKELWLSSSLNSPSSRLFPGTVSCAALSTLFGLDPFFNADLTGTYSGGGNSERSLLVTYLTEVPTLSSWPGFGLYPYLDSGTLIPLTSLTILILLSIFNLWPRGTLIASRCWSLSSRMVSSSSIPFSMNRSLYLIRFIEFKNSVTSLQSS